MAGMKYGAWCHIEIPTSSPEATKRFYGGLFGWTFNSVPSMNYTLYSTGDGEIGGGLFDPPKGAPRHITNYVNVADLEASAKKAVQLGGKVTDRMEVPGAGSFRIVNDPEGNVFGLWQSAFAPAPAPGPKAAKESAPRARATSARKSGPANKSSSAAKKGASAAKKSAGPRKGAKVARKGKR